MYAVIQVPRLPLQAWLRATEAASRGPLAILDESGGQSRVLAVNRPAAAFDVKPGMRPAQALARCEALRVEPRVPDQEAAVERLLHLLAQSWSPRVEATGPGLVTVDLRGTGRRKPSVVAEGLHRRLRQLRLHARIGLAERVPYARWAAALGRPIREVTDVGHLLRELPLAMLGAGKTAQSVMDSWGLRHLDDLRRLPREAVGRRLGSEGLALWDRVAGDEAYLLKPIEVVPTFRRERELEHRVETLEALLFLLRRFLEELVLELEASHSAAYRLQLELRLEDGGTFKKSMEVPAPSGKADTLFRILETALEGQRTKAAVKAVALEIGVVEARARQGDLFAVAMEDADAFAEAADRIAALVGPGRSGSPRSADSWRSDSFHMETLETSREPWKRAASQTPGPEPRGPETALPLRRCRPPRPLRVLFAEGRPAALSGRDANGAVRHASGPWRGSGDWWEAFAWSREEWDVELEGGGLYRIFRDACGWFLEGSYG